MKETEFGLDARLALEEIGDGLDSVQLKFLVGVELESHLGCLFECSVLLL